VKLDVFWTSLLINSEEIQVQRHVLLFLSSMPLEYETTKLVFVGSK
jgi:hypothetical protein